MRFSKATSFDFDEALDKISRAPRSSTSIASGRKHVAKSGGGAPDEE
jgi:hypothetical protein